MKSVLKATGKPKSISMIPNFSEVEVLVVVPGEVLYLPPFTAR